MWTVAHESRGWHETDGTGSAAADLLWVGFVDNLPSHTSVQIDILGCGLSSLTGRFKGHTVFYVTFAL